MVSVWILVAVLVVAAAAIAAAVAWWTVGRRRVSPGRIVFVSGPRQGEEAELLPGRLRIGALDDNDIVIPSQQVSRYHAELRVRDGRVHIWDLQSSNSTYVNGHRVETCELHPGDVIHIGDAELRYDV